VSNTRPVLETKSRFDLGQMPRLSAWMRLFDSRAAKAGGSDDLS
jgi:hypothetical protein